MASPERFIIEAFRVLVFGELVNPMPKAVYDALWSGAAFEADTRRVWFENAFPVLNLPIGDFEFVLTMVPEWFIAYNDAVEAGEAPVLFPCPCNDFQ